MKKKDRSGARPFWPGDDADLFSWTETAEVSAGPRPAFYTHKRGSPLFQTGRVEVLKTKTEDRPYWPAQEGRYLLPKDGQERVFLSSLYDSAEERSVRINGPPEPISSRDIRGFLRTERGRKAWEKELIGVRAPNWCSTIPAEYDNRVRLNGSWVFPVRKLPRHVLFELIKLYLSNPRSTWMRAKSARAILEQPLLANELPVWKYLVKKREGRLKP